MAAWVGAISGLLAVAVGIFALFYADRQVKLARDQRTYASSLALGQFLLQLDKALDGHRDVHLKLRPGGSGMERKAREETRALAGFSGASEMYGEGRRQRVQGRPMG